MDQNLRVAITGGTSGLGLALVREWRRRGARVAFVARTPRSVEDVAQAHQAHGIVGDVARKEDTHPIALQITAALGGLDVLVNNASSLGPTPLALLADTECEQFELALATNVLGPFRLTRALLGALSASAREGRGAVVLNVSSDAAINAYAQWGAYGASKAALRHMSGIWGEELAAEGVQGVHSPSGAQVEVRLAGRSSLSPQDLKFSAVVFGAGDWHTRTEDRQLPPPLAYRDRLTLGPLVATVDAVLGHPRLVALRFEGPADEVWAGIARHGRPIQYAYLSGALALWDVWTPIAAAPVAFEPTSAGFALDWRLLGAMRRHGVGFATLTLAAGISSTGDPALDARLPLDEPYRVPASTAAAIWRAKAKGGRIVAVGTTVVRALEHSAGQRGEGVADQRFGERIQPGARPFAPDALQGDPRALDEQEELVGDALGPGVAALAHQSDQALALAPLVRLDHLARGVLALGELDRRIGERAA